MRQCVSYLFSLLAAPIFLVCLGTNFCQAAASDDTIPDTFEENTPAYSRSAEFNITIAPDLTAIVDKTIRITILRESAIAEAGQQDLHYQESVDPLEIVEAYTQKPNSRHIDVDPSNILTRDE